MEREGAICTVHGKGQPAACVGFQCSPENQLILTGFLDSLVTRALEGQSDAIAHLSQLGEHTLRHSKVRQALTATTEPTRGLLRALEALYVPTNKPLSDGLTKITGVDIFLAQQTEQGAYKVVAYGQILRSGLSFLNDSWRGVTELTRRGVMLNPNFGRGIERFRAVGVQLPPSEQDYLALNFQARYTTNPDAGLVTALRGI
ncbi:hypothetical protein A3B55_01820 [Candidatus Daviesbacteria bacterium RIFCSPLOWO2_01_FULL_43_15]|nr:MAG: hypothetical protein A3B55_01820 [Candidatus Daviesbacteria bacterium RIFCSPLOWO2_01_FULL_43_15]